MNSKKIFFSIITPVLNEPQIKKTFISLKKQNFKNFEHIVIDGGSEKKTLSIIRKNKKYISKLIIDKDDGIYDAINKGIKISKGEVIGILNADDYYYKDTLSIAHRYFKNNKIDYLFGSVVKERLMHGFWPNKIWYKFNIYPAHSCGFFVKKKLHKKIGLYDTKFKYSSDRDFIFKMIKRKFVGMNTKKYEIFGKFNPYGVSSKLGFFKGFKEEIRVRLNNQNILFVILLSFITLLYGLLILLLKKK